MNVSVVIPAYNAAQTLADTLHSLSAQLSPAWEAIVVDDGSTDSTAALASTFAERDPRIRVVTQPNGGESAARNTGIDLARYDWLLFLDADDWIAPGHLERLTRELSENPELDAVHCGSVRVASDGTQIADDYQPPAGDMFPTLARRAAFPVHACLVRKSLVVAVGKFDTSLKKSPDWDLWQRVARTGAQFGAVREVLAYYRMQPQSASLDAEQLFRDGLRVLARGHAPDPRVKKPHASHVNGLPPDEMRSQCFYLMCWCAGLMIGSGKDPRSLLDAVRDVEYPDLYPPAIAQCIFEAATLPLCRTYEAWESLWPDVRHHVEVFLPALEAQSGTVALADRALVDLKRRILSASATWKPVIEEAARNIAEKQATIEQQKVAWDADRQRCTACEEDRHRLNEQTAALEADRNSLSQQLADVQAHPWVRLGRRIRLVRPVLSPPSSPGASVPPATSIRTVEPGQQVVWGDLRRLSPISAFWGFDRGHAIDRHYIGKFLQHHHADIHGHTLEIKDSGYTQQYGVGVVQADVLDMNRDNPQATIVADLTRADSVASDAFDCVVLTQTLHEIYDYKAALSHVYRMLKPGGVLLCTAPALSRIDMHDEGDRQAESDFWRFTGAALSRLFAEFFPPGSFEVEGFGNVLTCAAFLFGLSSEELTPEELDFFDQRFPLLYCVRAVKPVDNEGGSGPSRPVNRPQHRLPREDAD